MSFDSIVLKSTYQINLLPRSSPLESWIVSSSQNLTVLSLSYYFPYSHLAFPSHRAIWVGSPPAFRGREEPGRDLEQALIKAFPDTALFIEKPVSTGPVDQAFQVAEDLKKSGNLVSVGYMLRYLKVVQKMKWVSVSCQKYESRKRKMKSYDPRSFFLPFQHRAFFSLNTLTHLWIVFWFPSLLFFAGKF